MESERITVVARSKARPGMEDRLADAAAGLVAPTRDEEGCINYDLHRSNEDPSEILFTKTGRVRPTSTGIWVSRMSRRFWINFRRSPRMGSRSRSIRW